MSSPEADDWQLLDEYAAQRSEAAFRALVDVQKQMTPPRGRVGAAATGALILALLLGLWLIPAAQNRTRSISNTANAPVPDEINSPPALVPPPSPPSPPALKPAKMAPSPSTLPPQKNVLRSLRFDLSPNELAAHAAAAQKWRAAAAKQ